MEPDLSLRDVLSRAYVGVAESDGLRETVRLLVAEGADAAVVVRGERPVGAVTPREVMGAVAGDSDPDATDVAEVMAPVPPTVSPEASLRDVAAAFGDGDTPVVLVSEGDRLVGTVAARDLVALTATTREGIEGTDAPSEPAAETVPDGYSGQSVCERCGALSRRLSSFNGQLLCRDCLEL